MINAIQDKNTHLQLRQLRAFAAVAEEGHFGRAAERMHIGQPALSRTVKGLEEAIGVALFARTTRRVELTPAGRALYDECTRAFAAITRGVTRARQAASGESGHLSVAYMDFAINGPLPAIIERFRRRVPKVEVSLFHMPTARQREAIAEGGIDVAFLIGPFEQGGIQVREVVREPLVALMPADHPLAKARRVSVRQIAREPFVVGSPESWAAFRAILDRLFARIGVRPTVVQETSTSDGIMGLVAAKMGVSLYPRCALSLRRDGVAIRPLREHTEEIPTLAAWQADSPNPAVHRFVEALLQPG